MEECGVRGEVDPNLHLVNELEDELNDQAGDELEHELKLGGKHQRGRVAGSVEARFQSTDIRMVSLISSQLCQVWSVIKQRESIQNLIFCNVWMDLTKCTNLSFENVKIFLSERDRPASI